ncbi:LysR family transcriptional regulator [Sneathiella litorea]|uniref:LysR family transcriptional regulator n=1 Tax=Sneathiella litorea TaxID=2606216 RepID=A0A6L8W8N1_9PROT|nr:LysR family transcriptional regulator [Sneathiella litorea]MZR31486.1 LysR family transcriptional regulator [Sneathiella litorea]
MIRFSLSQLEALFWVARLGSFRAAADHLGISQPSVTLRIHKLEEAINIKLLDRSGYRPTLTEAGSEIMRYTRQTLTLAGKIQTFHENNSTPMRVLRFGMVDYTAMTEMPKLLRMFEEHYPELHIDVTVDYGTRLNALLAERKLDLAVLTEPKHHPGMEALPVRKIDLAWAGSTHLELPKGKLRAKDLVDQRIVTNPPPSNLYNSIFDWFGAAGLSPERISTCNTLSGMMQLVVEGFAISVLPTSLLDELHASGTAFPIHVSRPVKAHSAYVAFNNDNSDATIQSVLRKVVDALLDS